MRFPVPALVLPLVLAGCALPPAVSVASLVLDGVSYITTGKSPTDHAISAFANEDCALLRVVEDKEICDPDGEVLFAMVRVDEAYNYAYVDPENGSPDPDAVPRGGSENTLAATAEPVPEPQLSVAPNTPKNLGEAASTTPRGTNLASLASAIKIVTKPSQRGLFADARPVPKPQHRQLSNQIVSRFTRPTQQDGGVITYAVIGSFQVAENARRVVRSRHDSALIQAIEVNGETTYRILVDRPLEQARNDGFSDAWPVRLCWGGLEVPPCGQFVVSQAAGVDRYTTQN